MAMGEFNPKHAALEIFWVICAAALISISEISTVLVIFLSAGLAATAPFMPQ